MAWKDSESSSKVLVSSSYSWSWTSRWVDRKYRIHVRTEGDRRDIRRGMYRKITNKNTRNQQKYVFKTEAKIGKDMKTLLIL